MHRFCARRGGEGTRARASVPEPQGGGPAGATAATDIARQGHSVLLLDKAGRIKPCGGAIPPRLIRDFEIPDHLLVAKVSGARIVSPSDRRVDMPIENGFVAMVDRDVFDEWLRQRAVSRERRVLLAQLGLCQLRADAAAAVQRLAAEPQRWEP